MVDASALLAILLTKPDGDRFAARLSETQETFTLPLAIYEATLRLTPFKEYDATTAEAEVRTLLAENKTVVIGITDDITPLALVAFERYGRGRHPAFNFGDCFAYACAKARDATLLYKGNDFARTDLA